MSGWIARFGVPSTVTTDHGPQFESALWRELTQLLGTLHCRTTAYHPCANGLIECFHRQLKSSFRALPDSNEWADALPLILLGIWTALKDDLKCTIAELVYGTTLRLPGEFFTSDLSTSLPDPTNYATHLKETMSRLRAQPLRKQQPRQAFVQSDLSSGTHAFIHHNATWKSLQQPYDGTYCIIRVCTLEVKGCQEVVSFDRLKPAYLDTRPVLAECQTPQQETQAPKPDSPSNTTI